jgi:hypothetical protein
MLAGTLASFFSLVRSIVSTANPISAMEQDFVSNLLPFPYKRRVIDGAIVLV